MDESPLCWNCCHAYLGPVVHLPIVQYHDRSFQVIGQFCSYNCAKTFGSEHRYDVTLLALYHKRKHPGTSLQYIKPAPPREILRAFGGVLDIDEYRANFHTDDRYVTTEWPITVTKRDYTKTMSVTEMRPPMTLIPRTVAPAAPLRQESAALDQLAMFEL